MRRSYPTGLSYTIAITNDRTFSLIKKIVEKKESDLEMRFESRQDARHFLKQSVFFILQNHHVKNENFLNSVFNKNNPYESSTNTFALIQFLDDFKINVDIDDLEIIIGENDVDGFRLASFIAAYLETKNKKVIIKDTKLSVVPLLYGPHIQETSLKVLYSLIDYRLKNGRFPTFSELKSHHYDMIKKLSIAEDLVPENTIQKNRIWSSPNDAKFVSSLYAAQRHLETMGLITKHIDPSSRTITDIEPTLNGFLAVIFSDLGEKMITIHSIEDDESVDERE
jgi:hypothetical protein